MIEHVSGPEVMVGFAAALREIEAVTRDSEADHGTFTHRFASLDAVVSEVVRALSLHDCSMTQVATTNADEGMIYVHTTVIHMKGDYVTFTPLGLRMGSTPQQAGSAITYARRYALMSLFAIPAEDDDGRAANAPARPQQQPRYRTADEESIHDLFRRHPPEIGAQVRRDFREHFGAGLSELAVGRHTEALEWVQDQVERILDEADPEDDQ